MKKIFRLRGRTNYIHRYGIANMQHLAKDINWAELPSPAVENIYSFLSRGDQDSMSQVYPQWASGLDSPCLWKTMKFYLFEHDYNSKIYPEVKFARKYGHLCRHVEIICKENETHLAKVIRKQLKFFLKALTEFSQLTSIKFIDLETYFHHWGDLYYLEDWKTHKKLFKIIISFFKSQRNLKNVIFRNSAFLTEWGMELLKAIFHSDCNNISSLTLRGFVTESTAPALRHKYMLNLTEVCRKIVTVQSLEMNYIPMFEDIINKVNEMFFLGNYQLDQKKPCLSKIKIYCGYGIFDIDPDDPTQLVCTGILPAHWKNLRSVLRDLRVSMDLWICDDLAEEMEFFLVREMPVSSLEFRFKKSSVTTDISDLLEHLQACRYRNFLENLNVIWFPPVADFARSIIPFVQGCYKLKILHLHTESMPNEIEAILKELLRNHPTTLKYVNLRFNNCQVAEGDNDVKAISEAYHVLFRLQGMEFSLVVERN